MSETTTVRLYEADKEAIEELTDENRSWPSKIQEVVTKAEALDERGSDVL